MHKWQIVHDGLANAHDHQYTTSSYGVSRGAHTALNTSTFQDHSWLDVFGLSKQFAYGFAILLAALSKVDLVGRDGRHNCFGKIESLGLNVGDGDWVSTGCPSSSESQETDRASSADDYRSSECKSSRVDAVEDNAEWLEEGAFGKRDIVGKPILS